MHDDAVRDLEVCERALEQVSRERDGLIKELARVAKEDGGELTHLRAMAEAARKLCSKKPVNYLHDLEQTWDAGPIVDEMRDALTALDAGRGEGEK